MIRGAAGEKMRGEGRASIRRCLGCRERALKQELLRFVACVDVSVGQMETAGRVVIRWDRATSAPGRGAYVHPRLSCVARVGEGAVWAKALRAPQLASQSASVKSVLDDVVRSVLGAISLEGAGEQRRSARKSQKAPARRVRL